MPSNNPIHTAVGIELVRKLAEEGDGNNGSVDPRATQGIRGDTQIVKALALIVRCDFTLNEVEFDLYDAILNLF